MTLANMRFLSLSLYLLAYLATQIHAQSAICPALGSTLAIPDCSTMLAAIYSCDARFSTAFTSCSSEYSSCYGASGKVDSVFGSVLQVRSLYCGLESSSGSLVGFVSASRTGTSAASVSTSSGAVVSSVSSAAGASSGSGSSTATARTSSPSPSSTMSQASPSATGQSAAVATRPLVYALYACVGFMVAALLA